MEGERVKKKTTKQEHGLLQETMRRFVLCVAVLFLLSAPVFYWLTERFYAEDLMHTIRSVSEGRGIPPLDLEEDIVEGMMIQFAFVFLVICGTLFFTLRLSARRLWAPFERTLHLSEEFSLTGGDLPRFEASDIREFARLNHTLQALMKRNREQFRIQKEFTENASHELQTPLALQRNLLDDLLQQPLGREAVGLVSKLFELNTRMEYLNRDLLLLAQIDNRQCGQQENINPAELCQKELPLYQLLLPPDMSIELDDQRPAPTLLHANAALFECLLKNLVVNAIRHTPLTPNACIKISLTEETLSISNPAAPHAQPLPADTLFRRFGSSHTPKQGHGLGLAIVKAVCDYHGWSINYHFAKGQHCFCVNFTHSR